MTTLNRPFDLADGQTRLYRLRAALQEPAAMLRLAFPIMLIALVNMAMSITDTIMVSASFGADALAAVAVGSDFYSILFYLGAGTIGGLVPFYAAAVARGETRERARLERVGQAIVLLLAFILVPLVWTAPDWLGHLGLERGLLEAGRGYTRAMAVTLVPMLGVMLYRTILTAAERPRVFLYVTAAMVPLNAIGNQVLMHGIGPVPGFGPTGAGLSTLLVATVSLITLIVIARHSRPAAKVRARAVGWRDLAPVLRVGLPIGVATVAELGIFLGATLYAATLGAADVAAHTLTLRLAGVAYAVPAALLQAAMVRMARAEAGSEAGQRQRVVQSALGLTCASGLLLCLCLALAATPLAQAFFGGEAPNHLAAEMAVSLVLLLGVLELVGNPGLGAAGVLRGCKDTRAPMLYTLVGYWLIAAPLGLWLSSHGQLGIIGVWVGLAVGTAATSGLTLFRLFRRVRSVVRRADPA
jgi:MATE family multidrug resistance protein